MTPLSFSSFLSHPPLEIVPLSSRLPVSSRRPTPLPSPSPCASSPGLSPRSPLFSPCAPASPTLVLTLHLRRMQCSLATRTTSELSVVPHGRCNERSYCRYNVVTSARCAQLRRRRQRRWSGALFTVAAELVLALTIAAVCERLRTIFHFLTNNSGWPRSTGGPDDAHTPTRRVVDYTHAITRRTVFITSRDVLRRALNHLRPFAHASVSLHGLPRWILNAITRTSENIFPNPRECLRSIACRD